MNRKQRTTAAVSEWLYFVFALVVVTLSIGAIYDQARFRHDRGFVFMACLFSFVVIAITSDVFRRIRARLRSTPPTGGTTPLEPSLVPIPHGPRRPSPLVAHAQPPGYG